MTDARRRALSLAAATFALVAPAAYVLQRLFEVARAPAPVDPVLVLRDAHTAFYWRAATATWWGGLVAIAVFAMALRRHPTPVARALGRLAGPLVVALALLAWWFP